MSSEELKPCPFCGGDVSFHKDEECDGCHFIQCGQCRAFFDFATGADPGNDCASVDALRAAIAPMWNTRADYAALEAKNAALAGANDNLKITINGLVDELDALAAELAAIKGQEPVAIANKGNGVFWVKWTDAGKSLRGPGIKLYTLPAALEGGEV